VSGSGSTGSSSSTGSPSVTGDSRTGDSEPLTPGAGDGLQQPR
jgi:hypothetical protein